MEPKTVVIFRVWRSSGEVFALFPGLPADRRIVTSYQHNGQHGAADYAYCIRATRPATPAEYSDLHAELTRIGYNLDVKKRRTAPCT